MFIKKLQKKTQYNALIKKYFIYYRDVFFMFIKHKNSIYNIKKPKNTIFLKNFEFFVDMNNYI